jgi:hypothetical protein
MSEFEKLINECETYLIEAPEGAAAPAAPAAPPAPAGMDMAPGGDMMAGDPGGLGAPGLDMGMDQDPGEEELDNESKRDTDPREYTRSILSLLVDDKEGVTPEMFDDFMDSVSLAITKIKDKEGIKKFYASFYQKLGDVLDLRDELKSMFKQMSGTLDDLVGAQSEPDAAGGGSDRAGPSGPGVK